MTLALRGYATKKELQEAVGQPLRYTETSAFGAEYREDGVLTVVGPSATLRKFFARVTMEDGLIKAVE